MESLIQRKPVDRAARGRGGARLSLATPFLTALFLLLIIANIFAAQVRIDADGGIERYIRYRADFRAVITGGLMIREGNGAALYDMAAQHEAQVRVLAPYFTLDPDTTLPNSHPPYESFFAAAFGGPPYAPVFIAWTIVELLTIGAALWLLARVIPLAPGIRWAVVAGALAYLPLLGLLLSGQSSTLILLGLVGTYAGLKTGRPGWAGVGLALMLLKPQLAMLVIPLLLLSRLWRPLVVAAAIHGALAVAAMPLLGIAWPLKYVRYLYGSRSWDARLFEYAPEMHNWRSLVAILIEPIAPAFADPAIAILTALTLVLVGVAWWRQRAAIAQRRTFPDSLWALITVANLLIAHHLYEQDLILLIFAAWLIVAGATTGGWAHSRAWLALVVAGGLLPTVTIALASRQAQISISNIVFMAVTVSALSWLIWRTSHSHPSPATNGTGPQPTR